MKHHCPYCFTDTESRRGLHSHMMQKKPCREKMEADACISESASETANKQNNSNSPSQHANETDKNSPNYYDMDFEVTPPAGSSSSPNHHDDDDADADASDDNQTRWIEEFPYPAGVPIGEGVSCFEEWRRNQNNKNEPPWSPFESQEEWELARWIITSGISKLRGR